MIATLAGLFCTLIPQSSISTKERLPGVACPAGHQSAGGLEVRFWCEAGCSFDNGIQELLVFVVPVYRVIALVKPFVPRTHNQSKREHTQADGMGAQTGRWDAYTESIDRVERYPSSCDTPQVARVSEGHAEPREGKESRHSRQANSRLCRKCICWLFTYMTGISLPRAPTRQPC